ncbi:hypothetical protein [Paraburkholderia sp. BCC1886]|uniref:hypothetical protein n=1 Tax=Paraburkholderia sp. BCC1886 TaxID=2562670 RepID=UPI0011833FD0|nr:hypothetical protein [Paraburkholderia sp. BCC1886]
MATDGDNSSLLRDLWMPFFPPIALPPHVFQHLPIAATMPAAVVTRAPSLSLDDLLAGAAQTDCERACIAGALTMLERDWALFTPETKDYFAKLQRKYPRELHWIPRLSELDAALLAVRWETADAIFESEKRRQFDYLVTRGVDLAGATLNFGVRGALDTLISDVPKVLQALVLTRIDCDVAAISSIAPTVKPLLGERIRRRARAAFDEMLNAIGDINRNEPKLTGYGPFEEMRRELKARIAQVLDTPALLERPTTERIEALRKLEPAGDPTRSSTPAEEQRTRAERWQRAIQNHPFGAGVIVVMAVLATVGGGIAGFSGAIKSGRDLFWPAAASAPAASPNGDMPRKTPLDRTVALSDKS